MKSSIILPDTYLEKLQTEERQRALEAKQKTDPNAVLTDEDIAAADDMVEARLQAEMLNEQPSVKPEKVVKVYQQAVPEITLVTPAEKEQRADRRNRAVIAYAKGLTNNKRMPAGLGKFTRRRADNAILKFFTPEEIQQYNDWRLKMESSYYQDKGLSQDEIDQQIYENTTHVYELMVNTIMRELLANGDLLAENLSDDKLIENYPKLAPLYNLVTEGHAVIQEAKQYLTDQISPEVLAEYDAETERLTPNATRGLKRMAVMADPHYPYVNLESILNADPHKLNILIDPPDAIDDEHSIEAVLGVDAKDNIATLATDARFNSMQEWDSRIAANLGDTGMSYNEMTETMLVMDADGKTYTIREKSPGNMLSRNHPLFIVSKYGDTDPLPIMLDETKDAFTPIIGYNQLADTKVTEPVPPQELGGWAKFVNWLSETFNSGAHSAAMEKYLAEKQVYDNKMKYVNMINQLKAHKLPDAVQKYVDDLKTQNEQIAAQRQKHENTLDDCVELMHLIGDKNAFQFDRTLTRMMVEKAYTEPVNSPFRTFMFNLLAVNDESKGTTDMVTVVQSSTQLQSFAWKLRQYSPDLVRDLQSGDREKAIAALDVICNRFKNEFKEKFDGVQPHALYKKEAQRLDDEKTVVQPGKLLSINDRRLADAQYHNEKRWDTILRWYGPIRDLNLDWVPISGTDSTYNLSEWRKMKNTDVDLSTIHPSGHDIDARTFASLGMVMSLREFEFYKEAMGHGMPDTMPFEDIVVYDRGPRPNTRMIIDPIVEPTRANLLNYLRHMDEPVPGSDLTGKELMAKDLAKTLHILVSHADNYAWDQRTHAIEGKVCGKVLDFVNEHGMMQLIKDNGLKPEEIDKLQMLARMGELCDSAFDASHELLMDAESDTPQFTDAQRLDCINRIIIQKAIQADVAASRKEMPELEMPKKPTRPQEPEPTGDKAVDAENMAKYDKAMEEHSKKVAQYNKDLEEYTGQLIIKMNNGQLNTFEYSPIARDITKGGVFLQDLADRMMPPAERQALAAKGNAAILDFFKKSDMVDVWKKKLQANEPEENRRRLDIRLELEFKNRLDKLRGDENYALITAAADQILKNGDPRSKQLLTRLSNENLQYCNQALKDKPDMDFNKALMANADKIESMYRQSWKPQQPQKVAPNAAGPAR